MPFFVLCVITLLAGLGVRRELWRTRTTTIDRQLHSVCLSAMASCSSCSYSDFPARRLCALAELGADAARAPSCTRTDRVHLARQGTGSGRRHRDRNLVLLYVSFIPVLWTSVPRFLGSVDCFCWFRRLFMQAALTAMFTGVSVIGFPVGGWLADRTKRRSGEQAVLLAFTLAQAF